jgi:hypothetical protein
MKTDLSAQWFRADRSNASEIARFDGRLIYSGEIATCVRHFPHAALI